MADACPRALNHSNIKWCAFSRSSDDASHDVALTRSYNRTKVWDSQTGDCLSTIHHEIDYDSRRDVCSHTGNWSVVTFRSTSANTGTVAIWDPSLVTCVCTLQNVNMLYCCDISPDGSYLAIGSYDDTITVWNTHTNHHVRTLQGRSSIQKCKYSMDGTLLAGMYINRVMVWNPADGTCICTCVTHSNCDCVFSPRDASLLVTTSMYDTVNLWNARTGVCLNTLVTYQPSICVFSSDGNYLATASNDKTTSIWNVYTGTCVHTIRHEYRVLCCNFSSDSLLLITASEWSRAAHIWPLPFLPRHGGKLLLMIVVGHECCRLWLPSELWDLIHTQWFSVI